MIRLFYYVVVALFCCHSVNAQELSKKDDWMRRQLIDTPRHLTLDRFLPIWFRQYSCNQLDYCDTFGAAMQETSRDSKFVYFRYVTKKRSDSYKVLLSHLEHIKFDTWCSCKIKYDFFNKSVAAKDKAREPDLLCTSTPTQSKYTYTYIPNINSLRIDLHWKIYCGMTFKLVNKMYCAIYNFDTGTFTDIK